MNRILFLFILALAFLLACNNPSNDSQANHEPAIEEQEETVFEPSKVEELEGWSFPGLDYNYNALEPYMDEQTVYLHYEKHHKGYYNRLIKAIRGTELASIRLEDLLENSEQYDGKLINNAAQHFNHILFWEELSPDKTELSEGSLYNAIVRDFGSFEAFKNEFSNAAKTKFGSGWAWLNVDDGGKLFVSTTSNHINPIMDIADMKGTPLLCLDVWEHAYYLKYQNKRQEYIDAFWNIVNWKKVEERYKAAVG